jgi:hypothetical protein
MMYQSVVRVVVYPLAMKSPKSNVKAIMVMEKVVGYPPNVEISRSVKLVAALLMMKKSKKKRHHVKIKMENGLKECVK